MIRRLTALGLAGLLLAGVAVAGDEKDLAALAGKAATWKGYAFTVEQTPGPAAGKPLEGAYQAGQPVRFKADGIEFYRQGQTLVYQDGGRWQKSRTGTLSDPLRILGPSARVRAVAVLPHEELASLAGDLADVKKLPGEEQGATVYTGKLTAKALQKWAPPEVRSVAREGTVRVWASNGEVVRYAVTLRLEGRLGNAEVNGTSTRTVSLRGVGSTKVEVPDAARKALE
jgi:hypothetical protein